MVFFKFLLIYLLYLLVFRHVFGGFRWHRGPLRVACSMQPLPSTPAASVTSEPGCSEYRLHCHHLLASGPYVTWVVSAALPFVAAEQYL